MKLLRFSWGVRFKKIGLQKVLNEYQVRGNEFLLDAFNSSKYLEDLTGISEMLKESHEVSRY